jgi:hypothetical protein
LSANGGIGKSRTSNTSPVSAVPKAAEEVGFGTCRGERKADASRGLDDTGGDFQETKTQRPDEWIAKSSNS